MAAISLVLLASPAVAGARGPGPDLVVSAGKLSGDPFVFYGGAHQPKFAFTAVTANHGSVRAGPTETTVYLTHGGKRWRLADRAVPALAPGGKDRGRAKPIREPRLPLGSYAVVLCANARKQVAEGNEANNCRKLPDPFYVISTGWNGSISGTSTLGPLIDSGPIPGDHSLEKWQATDLDFFFNEYKGDGVFDYELILGTVDYQDGGIDAAGCRYSGGGTNRAAGGSFTADYSGDTYTGIVGMAEFYEIQVSCPESSNLPLEGPAQTESLSTDVVGRQSVRGQSLLFGSFTVAGSNADRELGSTWRWSLAAEKP